MPSVPMPSDGGLGRIYACLMCQARWLVPVEESMILRWAEHPNAHNVAKELDGVIRDFGTCHKCKSTHSVSWPARMVDIWGERNPGCSKCGHGVKSHTGKEGECRIANPHKCKCAGYDYGKGAYDGIY